MPENILLEGGNLKERKIVSILIQTTYHIPTSNPCRRASCKKIQPNRTVFFHSSIKEYCIKLQKDKQGVTPVHYIVEGDTLKSFFKMGWITKRYMQTGVSLAHNSKVGKRSGVLRKVVGVMLVNDMEYEELECGHKGRLIASVGTGGLFGVQHADSRRCMECKKSNVK